MALTLVTSDLIHGLDYSKLTGTITTWNQDTTGNAATATLAAGATILATARNIGGVSFNGSAAIDLPGVNIAGNQNTSGVAATATLLATARTIGGVSFNGSTSINLPGVNIAGNQDTSGNAGTVTNGVYTVGNQTIGGTKTFSSGITISGANNTASKLILTNTASSNTWSFNPEYNSQNFTISEDANPRITLKSGGSVGIGTTTMHQDLNLLSSSTSQSLINIGTSNSSRFLNVGVLGSAGYIMMENAAALNIGTGGATRMSISSGGLATFKSSYVAANQYGGELTVGGSSTDFGIAMKYNQGGATSGTIYCSSGYTNSGTTLKLGTGSNTNQLVLKGDGNVGIGTDSPFGVTSNRIALSVNGTTSSVVNIGTGGTQRGYFYAESNQVLLNTTGALPLHLGTNGSNYLTISSGGTVFINASTAPALGSPKLFVKMATAYSYEGILVASSTNNNVIAVAHTGTQGLITTNYGTSGANTPLAFGTGGAAQLTISTGGVVNVNTTGSGTQKLQVIGGIQNWYDTNFNKSTKVGYDGIYISGAQHGYLLSPQDWVFYAGGVEKMRIASGGQVAIGTGVNTTKLRVLQSANSEWTAQFINTGTGPYGVSIDTTAHSSNAYSFAVYTNSNTGLFVKNDATVLIGTTTPTSLARLQLVSSNAFYGFVDRALVSNIGNPAGFFNSAGTFVGGISTNNTSTSYATSSDYRLKENVKPITDALSRLNKLKPSRFNFIGYADNAVDGFIAHEVQDIVPEAISGEKNAINEDGTPKYQGIDQSKIVPLLTAAIQEQQAQIELLKQEVELLKQ